jgi:hypothetical protein
VTPQRFDRASVLAGAFFVLAGVAFLLQALGAWTLRAEYLVPLLLIGFGLAVLLGGSLTRRPGR